MSPQLHAEATSLFIQRGAPTDKAAGYAREFLELLDLLIQEAQRQEHDAAAAQPAANR